MENLKQIKLNTRQAGSMIYPHLINLDNHNISSDVLVPRGSVEGTEQRGYISMRDRRVNAIPFNNHSNSQAYGRPDNTAIAVPSALERVRTIPKRKKRRQKRLK